MRVLKQAAAGSGRRPFFYRDAGTLEFRSGGGCLTLFGLPFLLAGLFVMQFPLGLIPLEERPEGPLVSALVILLGSVFALVGAILVFGRAGLVLDRGRGWITQWYGLLVPMKRVEYLLDSIRQVEMDFSRGDSDSADTWPVTLSGEGIPKPIAVAQPVEFAEARRIAEELARFLHKPLVDRSTGERVTRDAGHLDDEGIRAEPTPGVHVRVGEEHAACEARAGAGERLDKSRLARAVRPEHDEDLARRDLQARTVHDGQARVIAGDHVLRQQQRRAPGAHNASPR